MRRVRLTPRGEFVAVTVLTVAAFLAVWGAYALGAWVLGV